VKVSIIRVLKTATTTLTQRVYVDETLTNATAGLSVTVRRLDGTVVTGPTAANNPSTGIYTYDLPGQANLDHLDVSWVGTVGGSAITLVDRVEIVGGYFFGLPQARASDSSLANPVAYPTAMLAEKRIEVEQECERICGRAFVPRFARLTLSGDGTSVLNIPVYKLRAIRAISTHSWPDAAAVVTPLTNITFDSGGTVIRYDGGIFPYGISTVTVEIEHGEDYPPAEITDKAMYRLRSLLNLSRLGVPDRVSTYTTADGATYRLTLPTRGSTGIPEVDAVYCRYEAPPLGFA
jgi:hypothetical protein